MNAIARIPLLFCAAGAALLLAACSASEPDSPAAGAADDPNPYILFGYGQAGPSIGWTASSQGRASTDIIAFVPESVGVFGYNNFTGGMSYQGGGEVFHNTRLYWREGDLFASSGISSWLKNPDTGMSLPTDGADNLWPYSPPMPWLCEGDGVDYKFFAYSPYTPYGSDIEAFGRSYDSFESIEWHHVPKYSSTDYMVSDRILQYTSRMSHNLLQQLTMEHLQARVRFCFKLGDTFSSMRMVRVKQVEVVSHRGFLYTLKVSYAPVNEGGQDVLRPSFTWTVEQSMDASDFTLTNDPDPATMRPIDYIEMSRDNADYQPLASLYAFPDDALSAIQLRVTYDVYDYYPESGLEPVLLRENDVAVNTVPLNFRASSATTGTGPKLKAGYYYDVRIRIEPTYLYVLSDNDFDADGFLVVSDD